MPDAQHPEPDAVTGATPKGDFELRFNLSFCPMDKCKVLVEINQSWDRNEHYTDIITLTTTLQIAEKITLIVGCDRIVYGIGNKQGCLRNDEFAFQGSEC